MKGGIDFCRKLKVEHRISHKTKNVGGTSIFVMDEIPNSPKWQTIKRTANYFT